MKENEIRLEVNVSSSNANVGILFEWKVYFYIKLLQSLKRFVWFVVFLFNSLCKLLRYELN